jgi:hypothetical protein
MTSSETKMTTLVGTILEEEVVLSLAELCRASRLPAERVIELANEGIVDPIGRGPSAAHNGWRRTSVSTRPVLHSCSICWKSSSAYGRGLAGSNRRARRYLRQSIRNLRYGD